MLGHSLWRSVLRFPSDLGEEGERAPRHQGGAVIEACHEEIVDKCLGGLA